MIRNHSVTNTNIMCHHNCRFEIKSDKCWWQVGGYKMLYWILMPARQATYGSLQ